MLFITLLGVFALAHAQDSLLVNTTQGEIVGARAVDGNYFNFFGIHYGGSTSGENRFKGPTPPPKYPGTFHAIDNTVFCAQPDEQGIVGVEDCLTLNVFTKAASPAKPVLVWLEGEGYENIDRNEKSFARLVDRDVVVVQPNYRLSIFGFLCLGVAEAPGNAGLKDVVQALKWIRDNIAGFGGDPNNVILFGHGSGAAMVDLITMSPLANGLIHKAIAQSGSALAPWAIAYNPVDTAKNFGANLGYTDKTNEELAKLLVNTSTAIIYSGFLNITLYNNSALFAPCVENIHLNQSDTFLSEAPINILKSGNYSHIPYIAGYANREGSLRAKEAAQWLLKMENNFTDFLQVDLDFGNNLTNEAKAIRNFYFADKKIDISTIEDYLDYQGDTLILVSVIRGARERAATSRADVRLYEFTNKGNQNSDWPYHTIPLSGAKHGNVINFLLDINLRAVDQTVRQSLTDRYVSFFKTGVPSNNGTTWAPVTTGLFNFLLYSSDDGPVPASTIINYEEMRFSPHSQRMTFWDNLYTKYYKEPKPVSSGYRILGVTLIVFLSQLFVKLL